jgi:hypothetical protein
VKGVRRMSSRTIGTHTNIFIKPVDSIAPEMVEIATFAMD